PLRCKRAWRGEQLEPSAGRGGAGRVRGASAGGVLLSLTRRARARALSLAPPLQSAAGRSTTSCRPSVPSRPVPSAPAAPLEQRLVDRHRDESCADRQSQVEAERSREVDSVGVGVAKAEPSRAEPSPHIAASAYASLLNVTQAAGGPRQSDNTEERAASAS
ncbi:Piezo-type mechanosensitive ion channel component 1, partial [Frankliniella fusca]